VTAIAAATATWVLAAALTSPLTVPGGAGIGLSLGRGFGLSASLSYGAAVGLAGAAASMAGGLLLRDRIIREPSVADGRASRGKRRGRLTGGRRNMAVGSRPAAARTSVVMGLCLSLRDHDA
jgi:hypothetical protein